MSKNELITVGPTDTTSYVLVKKTQVTTLTFTMPLILLHISVNTFISV